MAQARRAKEGLAVVFIDLDRIKPVNDSLGHSGGDVVLKEVAERLKRLVREGDTVARVGGDEFVFLLVSTTTEGANFVCERILSIIERPIDVADNSVRISASAGVALYTGGEETPEMLIRQADLAMYAAKAAGRNRFCMFDVSMGEEVYERLELRQELAAAFDAGDLCLYYQPQIRLSDGEIVGAEALCRWFHEGRGSVPPDKFIPVAEESGLIVPIGRWVITEACSQAKAWQRDGLPELRMSVNVSAQQLQGADFVTTVAEVLLETEMHPSSLVIEVTESTALGVSEEVRESLKRLNAMGVILVVDDFGIGYSALDRIAELPFQGLKVDRSFVASMDSGPERLAIVRTVIDLGRHLSLETVAEGVETAEQAECLTELHCDLAQGFLYSPALAPDDFAGFVRARSRVPAAY